MHNAAFTKQSRTKHLNTLSSQLSGNRHQHQKDHLPVRAVLGSVTSDAEHKLSFNEFM